MVNLYYTGTDGAARAFAEEMERGGTADRVRAEAGNERYAYFFPADDPETVLLMDIWTVQGGLRMRAERYVTDREGIPEADRAFIRE